MKPYAIQNFKNDLGEIDSVVQIRPERSDVRIVTVDASDPVITPEPDTVYQCGTLSSLTVTNPPAAGVWVIVFISGATATDASFPETILGLADYTVEANTIYEINVLDSRAVIGSWAVSAS